MSDKSDGERRLYRSRTNRMMAGVCGGWGEFLGIDPNIVRVIFLALAFWGGSGVVIYLIMTLVIPENPVQEPAEGTKLTWPQANRNALLALGLLVILIGTLLLLNSLGIIPAGLRAAWNLLGRIFWPLFLVGLGVLLVISAVWGKREWWKEARLPTMGQPLYRSRQDRMIAGVCGGLGAYFHIDPTFVRLAWALITLASSGTGILVYLIAAIVIPLEPLEEVSSVSEGADHGEA